MKFAKIVLSLSRGLQSQCTAIGACILTLVLAAGCVSNQPKPKTATEEGKARWNLTRAGVLYGLAKDQFESGNLDDCRKTLNNASKFAPDHVLIRLLSA